MRDHKDLGYIAATFQVTDKLNRFLVFRREDGHINFFIYHVKDRGFGGAGVYFFNNAQSVNIYRVCWEVKIGDSVATRKRSDKFFFFLSMKCAYTFILFFFIKLDHQYIL